MILRHDFWNLFVFLLTYSWPKIPEKTSTDIIAKDFSIVVQLPFPEFNYTDDRTNNPSERSTHIRYAVAQCLLFMAK